MTVSFPFKILTGVDNIIIMRLKLTAENYVQYTGTVYLLGYDIYRMCLRQSLHMAEIIMSFRVVVRQKRSTR
jgi:hypothetical protein